MYQVLPNITTDNSNNVLAPGKYVASIVKGIADMVLIFDQDCKVVYANQKAGDLLQTVPEDLVGSNICEFFPDKQSEFLQALLQEAMEKDQVYNRSTLFQFKSGKKIPVSISFSTLALDDELEGYMLVAKDNRHLTQATDALKQKNEQLARLFYRMSHDLQGPLASIQGLLELTKMEVSDTQEITTYLTHIQSSTDKLKYTLQGLMQLQYEEEESAVTKVSVRHLLETVIDDLDDYPGREEVLVHVTANTKHTTTTDEHILTSILKGIVENSIKFRKTNASDTVIKVSVRAYKEGIKIKVKDNGLGMDRAMQQRAFDMFYRGHGHVKGSGLGLYVAKTAIEKLGGEIVIKSQPFLGTEVSIYIPSTTSSTPTVG
ncbi:MAG: PAS domain-containing sensor histidine kinase [Tunicatimonas sp.]|uniref:sensor histidine kinase n=1 Tax=Tunicatimonas sp. TaxID=1940096 RepID=UPI003C78A238